MERRGLFAALLVTLFVAPGCVKKHTWYKGPAIPQIQVTLRNQVVTTRLCTYKSLTTTEYMQVSLARANREGANLIVWFTGAIFLSTYNGVTTRMKGVREGKAVSCPPEVLQQLLAEAEEK